MVRFRSVNCWINRHTETVEYRRNDEDRYNHRIEPSKPAQGIVLKGSFPGLGNPGDDEPRKYEEHEDRRSAIGHALPEQAAAVALGHIVRHEHDKRGTE